MRVLITGVSSYLGARVAQALEQHSGTSAIIGIDTSEPRHELNRTEFVKVGTDNAAVLNRIIKAAAIDTVLDTRIVADPLQASLKHAHESNVTGTANLLAACTNQTRRLVFKSSAHYYGHNPGDPAFFTEEEPRTQPPRTAIERDIVQAEAAIAEFAAKSPDQSVAILRIADQIGGDGHGSHLALLGLPVVPSILGFDPRFQFVHADDVVGALVHAATRSLRGVYNVAADGVLALSEVVSLLGKPMLPILPPWGTAFAAIQLRRLGLRVPVEMARQLRFGRGLDNRRLKVTGYQYRYTSREAVLKLRAQQRLRPLLRSGSESYRYEREVEEFLRWSPSVHPRTTNGPKDGPPLSGYDELSASELIDLISSLDPDALAALSSYEVAHQARPQVLEALERTLARKRADN